MLTKEAIMGADDLPCKSVKVPEWKGSVLVWTLTGLERDAFEQAAADRRKGGRVEIAGLKALLVVLCVHDKAGARLFEDADADALNSKSGAAIDRLYQVAARLNHLLPEDIEELAGN